MALAIAIADIKPQIFYARTAVRVVIARELMRSNSAQS